LVTYVGTARIWIIVCFLIAYMFLAINLVMMLMERKLFQLGAAKAVEEISSMLSKSKNPKEYVLARLYFFGSLFMLLSGVVLLPYL